MLILDIGAADSSEPHAVPMSKLHGGMSGTGTTNLHDGAGGEVLAVWHGHAGCWVHVALGSAWEEHIALSSLLMRLNLTSPLL